MKTIFKTKSSFKKQHLLTLFFYYLFAAIVWSLFMHLLTWSKPELNEIMETIVIFEAIFVLRTIVFFSRRHLTSIHLDTEHNHLITEQLRIFHKNVQTVFNLDQLHLSELRNGWFTFFELRDNNHSVTISSSNYGVSEKKIKKMHHKLKKNQATAAQLITP